MTVESRRTFLRSVTVAAGAALLLAIAGAFDTGTESFGRRLIYWLIVMGIGSLWGQLCQQSLLQWSSLEGRPLLHIVALTIMVAVPMCFFVWVTTGLYFSGQLLPFSDLGPLVVPVLTVTVAVCAVIVFLGGAAPVRTHASSGPPKQPAFLNRVPRRLRAGRLLAIEAEDHYLRIHTTEGSDLILMRLADALGELEGMEGAQTHRSWWVAKDAVHGARRRDGRATLELEGGLTAPVSRRYARALREAGWYR